MKSHWNNSPGPGGGRMSIHDHSHRLLVHSSTFKSEIVKVELCCYPLFLTNNYGKEQSRGYCGPTTLPPNICSFILPVDLHNDCGWLSNTRYLRTILAPSEVWGQVKCDLSFCAFNVHVIAVTTPNYSWGSLAWPCSTLHSLTESTAEEQQ